MMTVEQLLASSRDYSRRTKEVQSKYPFYSWAIEPYLPLPTDNEIWNLGCQVRKIRELNLHLLAEVLYCETLDLRVSTTLVQKPRCRIVVEKWIMAEICEIELESGSILQPVVG